MIIASNLKKTFQHPEPISLLSGISFEARAGESIAITGRSGEGKTTLLHILGTLEPFNEGELFIQGHKIDPSSGAAALRNKHIGFVFQSFNLLEDFTALENVLMPACIGRFPLSPTKGLELLDSVGLKNRASYRAKYLSGGEKQRVALARALCNDPDLLLADEPTGNLDATNGAEVGELLFQLVRERKKTLILVTHNVALASRCDRQFTLSKGTLSGINNNSKS
jgi:lipoprotein-releasing system ATP-binding protein